MKSSSLLIVLLAGASVPLLASAFSPSAIVKPSTGAWYTVSTSNANTKLYQFATQDYGLVNVADVWSERDLYSMEEWATQYGMQKADGVELYALGNANEYGVMANTGVSAGQTAIYVPSDIVLNSGNIQQEFGMSLQQAEAVLIEIDQNAGHHWPAKNPRTEISAQHRLPLLRLMVKILAEYEKGTDSMHYSWLNSVPRQFYNGVSMTKACFKCLPPYAGWLTSNERINYSHFASALRQGYVPLSEETIGNKEIVKWAYSVALTRYHEIWNPERAKIIAPMADMLNHAAEPNCQIDVDYEGNVNVVALYDVPAGEALTVSLGDPTNPTPLFAQYGFLPNDCATIFCKAMHLDPQIKELGYEFQELLIQTESGEIAPKVWDVFLYDILQKNDPGSAQQFYMACQNNDEGTKEQYHGEWFAYTLDAMKQHVYSIMNDCEKLTMKAQTYDQNTHPRVPVIVAHNQLVSQTFMMTAALLEQMG